MFTRRAQSTILAALTLTPASAQTPATPTAPVNVVVVEPTYVSVAVETTVNKPVADVWARVGDYCDVRDWVPIQCTILSGKENELGAVRSTGNEVLVARTRYSYTYTQTPREGRPYNLYHGTLEARPITSTTTKLLYVLFFDNSMLPDDAAREKDRASKAAQFKNFLKNMKIISEGGALP